MYTPLKIIVNNIGPIESLTYDFNDKVVLLTGQNETDEGQESNGSGKSYLVEAFSYALTGTSFRKVTDSELVREGEKEGFIYLSLENKAINSIVEIERYVYSGSKSSILKIATNDPKQKPITSVNEGNKYILELLELSREDILNYFVISKEKYTSFFSSSDTDKKELISRFSKANIVDECFPLIEADKKKVTDQIVKIERDLIRLEGKIDGLRSKNPKEEVEKKNKQRDDQIIKLKENLSFLEKECSDSIKNEESLEIALQESETLLKKLPPTDNLKGEIKDKELSIAQLELQVSDLRKDRKETEQLLSQIEMNLAGVIDCPKCGHEFSVTDPDFDPKEGEEIKVELTQLIEALNSNIAETRLTVPEIEKAMQALNDEINKHKRIKVDIEIKITRYKSQIEQVKKDREYNIKRSNSIEIEIKELKNKNFEPENYSKEIKELEKEIETFNSELDSLSDRERDFDKTVLEFKSFKSYLANKSLSNITTFTNIYLEKLNSSLRVKFEGFKELTSGKTREKIDTRVFKFGEDKGSFGKLSGGEKARVEVATILALSGLINSSTNSTGLNMVILDEILESLDVKGIQSVLSAMNNIGQNVILISQLPVQENDGDKQIKIVKKSNVSSLLI